MFLPLRVFPAGRFHFMDVVGAPLGAAMGAAAAEFLRQKGLKFTPRGLRRGAHMFGWLWGWSERYEAAGPQLRMINDEGDPLLWHTASFAVSDADQTRRALMRRKDISHDREENTFTWFGGGVKSTRGSAPLSGPHRRLGTIELIADELVLTVNSAQRFEAARQWLAQLPGVTFQNVVTRKIGRNVNDIPADDRLNPARPVEITPEVADDIKSTFEQYYLQWLDTPLPILGGKSPRQACRTRTGREQVTTLIRTMPDPVGPVKIQAPRESLLRALGLS